MATAKDVAQWMVEQLKHSTYLDQEDVASKIKTRFGEVFTYDNENGNLAIGKTVLKEFRNLTQDTVVWDRADRCWRKRTRGDAAGRQQD